MQTSSLLLFLVALYPCAALASLGVPFVLTPLNRLMKENEDPRVAKAWVAIGVCGVGVALSLWIASRAPSSDVVLLRLGRYGFAVDQNGPLGVALVSLVGGLAAVAMRPQTPGLRMPHGWLLLATGAASLALLADDVRLALLGLVLALALLALTFLTDTDRQESRRAALIWFAATLPGVLVLARGLLSFATRAGTTTLGDIRNAVALEVPANVSALRWMIVGLAWLLTVPALPWLVRDVLSRRTLASATAALALSGALVGWLAMRLCFSVAPYAEGWELARRGSLVIPGLALVSAGLLVAAGLLRAPSPRLSLAIAATGPLPLLAFCQGRPAFATGVVLVAAVALTRVALLASQAADPAVSMPTPSRLLSRAHRAGVVLAGALLVLLPCLLLPRFVQVWFRVAFGLLLIVPAGWAAYRTGRFGWVERDRRQPVIAWLGVGSGVLVLALLAAWGPVHRASAGIEKELGLDLSFSLQQRVRSQIGAPPATPPDSDMPRQPALPQTPSPR